MNMSRCLLKYVVTVVFSLMSTVADISCEWLRGVGVFWPPVEPTDSTAFDGVGISCFSRWLG